MVDKERGGCRILTAFTAREELVVIGSSKRHKTVGNNRAKSGKTQSTKAARSKALGRTTGPRRKPIVIDVHAHIIVPEVLSFTYEHSMFAKAVAQKSHDGRPHGIPQPLMQRMIDRSLRLKDMDEAGVDIEVISPSILQQCTYWAEPDEALKMERLCNEHVAEAVATHPDRLVGLGSVPMQDVALACAELERCIRELGLKGIIISSHVNGVEIGNVKFHPFWAKAEDLGAVIFVHPAGNTDERMRRHRLLITLGQPLEEAFAQSSLVYDGVIDAFPKLKILMAHGGGFLPFYTGRHDNDWRQGHSAPNMKNDFSSYLPRFYYDTVLFNPDMLEFLVSKVSASHVMLASDYPFAEKRPVEFVRSAKKLSRKDQEGILGANAAKLFGLAV